MPFFKNVFKSKDGSRSASKASKYPDQTSADAAGPPKPRWEDAWARKDVAPEEIQELIHVCTQEMKSRALDMPFLLLPFRPASDTSSARNFVRNFFKASLQGSAQYTGEGLHQELRLTEPLVLCSILKWSWSRLPGGVVTWDAYELFRIGESDSNFARHAFDTFIPLSVDSEARKQIIFDFFDLLAAIAARVKTNGMGGRKLSRMAGWWAFEHSDDGKGFDGGYRSWERAADAASHLFFAYLRSLSPDPTAAISGISALPGSLAALVSETEYPPPAPFLMQSTTTRVVMIVDSVSPTPFALLRRAKHFEYRDDDEALQRFSAYEDPVKALTDECRRVLNRISSTNQSVLSTDEGMQDASWSRFEDFGFSGILESSSTSSQQPPSLSSPSSLGYSSFRSAPRSRTTDFGRPTTPSWADFLSSGFADENGHSSPAPLLLPPDKVLPPIGEAARVKSSQSHMKNGLQQDDLEPGELASITRFDLDDTFWWVWMTSLAAEEPTDRKAVFGRCALIETRIAGAKWLVIEEQVKGASPGPEEGAYIAEKKGRFSFTRRGRLGRRKSTGKKPPVPQQPEPYNRTTSNTPIGKSSIGPDQHARIQAAAARLAQNQKDRSQEATTAQRRARIDDSVSVKTNSVMTLQPNLMSDAGPAMQWDKRFGEGAKDPVREKEAIRAKYLGDVKAGRGSRDNLLTTANGGSNIAPPLPKSMSERALPLLPKSEVDIQSSMKQEDLLQPSFSSVAGAAESPSPRVTKAQSSTATELPLPTTAAKSPLPPASLDEKPIIPRTDHLDQHPALRKPLPERKPVAPLKQSISHEEQRADEGHISTSDVTAGKKPLPNKLKKSSGGGGGGFRKFFGKKKGGGDMSNLAAGPHTGTSEHESTLQAPKSDSAKPIFQHEQGEPTPAPHDSAKQSVDEFVVVDTPTPVHESSETASLRHSYRDSHTAIPSTETRDQREADHAFARFDQGPMDDMPAFVPDEYDDDEAQSNSAEPLHVPAATEPRPPIQQHLTHQQDEYHSGTPAGDDASEQSVEFNSQALPSQDRWAQIRRNAAERAARLSEEQSRRSQSQSNRTDEGETSGEETIESRVARIKARVAELTGNMDGQTTPTGGRR
jgi:hypothetical protein